MLHPKEIGDRTTLAVMFALKLRGETVLVPFGENVRYDLVADNGRRLSRIQCKTGCLRDGVIRFNVCSSYSHHAKPPVDAKRNYRARSTSSLSSALTPGPSIESRSKTYPTSALRPPE
jgi:hypothetical protein